MREPAERLVGMTAPPNPYAGMAMGLHSHVPDAECDDTCTFYPAVPTNDHERKDSPMSTPVPVTSWSARKRHFADHVLSTETLCGAVAVGPGDRSARGRMTWADINAMPECTHCAQHVTKRLADAR